MIVDPTKYVDFLIKWKINPHQFLLAFLLYTDEKENGRYPNKGKTIANIYKYASKISKWSEREIEDMIRNGVLDPNTIYSSTQGHPDNFYLTRKFKEDLFGGPEYFMNFWELYPAFHQSNNVMLPLKMISMEEVQTLYNKIVLTKIQKERVIEALEWALPRNMINMKIDNFLKSRFWDQILELKESDDVSENRFTRI